MLLDSWLRWVNVLTGLELLELFLHAGPLLLRRGRHREFHLCGCAREIAARGSHSRQTGMCDPRIGMRLCIPLEELQRLLRLRGTLRLQLSRVQVHLERVLVL